MKSTSTRKGTGAIMSGRQISHDSKRVKGHSTKGEHARGTGHIASGTSRGNKGQGKDFGVVGNPLRGALMSGANVGRGVHGHGPMVHPERAKVARPDAGHLGGVGRAHNMRPY